MSGLSTSRQELKGVSRQIDGSPQKKSALKAQKEPFQDNLYVQTVTPKRRKYHRRIRTTPLCAYAN